MATRSLDLNSYSLITFGTSEFDPRRRAAYLGDIGFFKRDLLNAVTDDDDDDDEADVEEVDEDDDKEVDEEVDEEGDDHKDEGFDGGVA